MICRQRTPTRRSTVCSSRSSTLRTRGPYPRFFFFNDTATTEIYTLSLHDALPIYRQLRAQGRRAGGAALRRHAGAVCARSEEHTSELQSQSNLVCRLLLEKKKKIVASVDTNAPL